MVPWAPFADLLGNQLQMTVWTRVGGRGWRLCLHAKGFQQRGPGENLAWWAGVRFYSCTAGIRRFQLT
jgi:hypothetical protein